MRKPFVIPNFNKYGFLGMPMMQLHDSEISKANKTSKVIGWVLVIQGIITLVGVAFGLMAKLNAVFVGVLLILSFCLLLFMSCKAKFKLEQIGIENIQLVGAKMSEEWRDRVWSEGYITLYEWKRVCSYLGIKF